MARKRRQPIEADAIASGYLDHEGGWREPPAETLRLFRTILQPASDDHSPLTRSITEGTATPIAMPHELHLEDGSRLELDDHIPPGIPTGYHELLDLETGTRTRLIVAPERCWSAARLRTWGWAAQLYCVRSHHSWGIGDLRDLQDLARWSSNLGAQILMVNPLHAAGAGRPRQPSPYFPSSRCAREMLYLRIEEVEGASEAGVDIDSIASAGRELNDAPIIDRDRIHDLKMAALERIWNASARDRRRDHPLAEAAAYEGFALFASLAEANPGPWRAWPAGLRRPDGPEVDRWRQAHGDRIAFHRWVQSQLDHQLEGAGTEISLITDLAIGVDPDGADAWLWQEQFASGVTVGAPPDEFNSAGQNWGVLAFDPFRLDRAGYEPFIQTVRTALRHSRGMRFDHVMGLWRLFWIPEGAEPAAGTYVRYPATTLLDILAIESHRAAAFIVGEDLGTVETVVREEMARRDMLSYRVFWFEDVPPRDYPQQAVATITNHDLPTIAGVWSGKDLRAQTDAGLEPDLVAAERVRLRLSESTGLGEGAPAKKIVQEAYRLLATAPSAILTATLEDALAVEERTNQPGTTDEFPNWSRALPRTLEQIMAAPEPRAIATTLARRP
ncbi:MAG: 4-alpha-glucanotransferase [Actinomycetota bacterium]